MVRVGILLCAVLWVGCARISDLSGERYRVGVLFSLPNETVVVLPMQGDAKHRGDLPMAESIFYKGLTEMRPQMQRVSPQESRARIEAASLSAVLDRLEDAVPFSEREVAPLHKLFGTSFFLQTFLDEAQTVEGATHVRIRSRLWDLEKGDILWEATGESRGYLFLFFPTTPASLEKTLEVASRGLIRKLP
jgi:hypothetical protein